MIQTIAFTCYPVSNMLNAREFYEKTLELSPSEGFGEFWQEYEVGSGTFSIAVAPEQAPDFFKNRGTSLAFEVENLAKAIESLQAKGVSPIWGPMETPVCHMAAITDPDNNVVVLHQLKNK